MHHPSLPASPPNLRRHVNKTLNLPPHIPTLHIFPIFPPLTAKDTSFRRLFPQRRDRVPHIRQPPPGFGGMSIVLPCAVVDEGGVGDVEHGLVDDADDGRPGEDEGDGDAEHGEEVGVVYGAVEGIDDPGRRGGDEVVSGAAGGVGFFAYESFWMVDVNINISFSFLFNLNSSLSLHLSLNLRDNSRMTRILLLNLIFHKCLHI